MRAAVAILLLLALAYPAAGGGTWYWEDHRKPNTIRVAVPLFDGGNIGRSVATIMNLQIFETLQRPQYGPANTGEVLQYPLPQEDFAKGGETAADAQLVLWGKAFDYAGQTIVQTYLRVNESEDAFTRWTIDIAAAGKTYSFETPLPSSDYVFDPIVLPSADVKRYADLSALNLYADPAGKTVRGRLGANDFRALEKANPPHEALKIQYRDAEDYKHDVYILVPQLTAMRTEVVDFTSALVRVMRQDWLGAIEYLDQTIARPRTPAAVRIDAHLLRALCNSKMRRPWKSDAERAMAINPYLASNVRYGIMLRLADIKARSNAREAIDDLASFTKRHRTYFEPADPLLVSVDRFLAIHDARDRRVESTHK